MYAKRVENINKTDKPKPFQVGDIFYYRRPHGSGTKLHTRWLGPATKEGSQSCLIQMSEGVTIKALKNFFLKNCISKEFFGKPIQLYYHQRTVIDPKA